jgi:hypothetical protein
MVPIISSCVGMAGPSYVLLIFPARFSAMC